MSDDLPPPPPDRPPDPPPPPPAPPKATMGLKDILERARQESEAESRRLMEEQRRREEEEARRAQAEAARKAEEARLRGEAERQRLEAALRDYEARQRQQKEAAERPAVVPVATSVSMAAKKSRTGMVVGVALSLVVAGALVGFLLWPRGELPPFPTDRLPETARPGTVIQTPVPYGARSLAQTRTIPDPAKVVAVVRPAPYEAPAPVVRTGPRGGEVRKKPVLDLNTGILGGGKKVVH